MRAFFALFVLSIVLSAAPAALFAAGGSDSSSTSEADAKEILFWHAFGDEKRSTWIAERAEEFNALQDEFTVVPERKGSYRETLQAAVLAHRQGDAPHIVQIFEVGSRLALDSGIFKPIGDIGSFDTSDYITPVLNYYTMNGKVHSIPFNSSSPILYTNKDMMERAGLDPEDPPETYGGILSAARRAKDAGLEGAGLGFNVHSWFIEQWMAQQGAMLVNNGNGRDARADATNIDSPQMRTIFEFIKTLNDEGLYKYTGKLEDWDGSDAIFKEGKVMFHITSTADLGNISDAAAGKFTLGTGRLPIADGARRSGVVIGGGSVWVLSGHPDAELEAARDFILYMTNTENMMDFHKLTGYYPVRYSSIDALEKEGWFEEFPERSVAFTQLTETIPNTATAGALIGSFLDTRTILEEAVQKVLNGADIEDALAEAQTLADTKLAEYKANL